MVFDLKADFKPTGDQPRAIQQIVAGIENGETAQVLMGVTGSGKTFTMANVVKELSRPTLILSHNKTLAAQLYGEFKQFFPNNAIEYFISYYDYYQPEAYLPTTDVYIEKDLSINEEIEKLRLSTTSTLLSGRRDVIVVASVSCIYGVGNPHELAKNIVTIHKGQQLNRSQFLFRLVDMLYSRTELDFRRGNFRVKGDTVDIFPAYADFAYRLFFWGDDIEEIHAIDPNSGKKIADENSITLFPANLFVTNKELFTQIIHEIQEDTEQQVKYFQKEHKDLEAARIKERTAFDLEMIRELGYCSGVENYSRYFDRRKPGERPFCLLDYFPDDYLLIIDESHVTVPQVRAMWGGDRSRKINLVEHGFRLPSALDNRPLTFNEFEAISKQTVFVSATPADYELCKAEGIVVEQIIRPTGLLDPAIEVRPSLNQIDDLLSEIDQIVAKGERVLITTLTKRMAEELTKYFDKIAIKARYIHSEIKPLERVEILRELRLGLFDVLVGVNLLREGLDLPEVSFVAIMDADKEGFLRNERSLIQTIGRAARNENGKVILYADKTTKSMEKAIYETQRRRKTQQEYNFKHDITPKTVRKSKQNILNQTKVADAYSTNNIYEISKKQNMQAAEKSLRYTTPQEVEVLIKQTKTAMEKAAKDLDFIEAARLRDEMFELEEIKKSIE